ncbi:serotransferrin-2-like [Diretmus argenteus]
MTLGAAAALFGNEVATVKWCVTSDQELSKCEAFAAVDNAYKCVCVLKESTRECIMAIKDGEADAITLDGGDIYTAGLENLVPIIAEDYGPVSDTCYYAVAVVKKNSNFTFKDLGGKKSCHTGLGKSAGWNIPIGTLLSMGQIDWTASGNRTLEEAVSDFFMASCAPGANRTSKLCKLCKKDCSKSQEEPYYGYDGAFKCLKDGSGEVAFVKHVTVPEAERNSYQLLCRNGSRTAISNYKSCYLAKVPAHAVVSRKDPGLAHRIYAILSTTFRLFSSNGYNSGKNLMFTDSTQKLVKLPPGTDAFLYLGAEYLSIIRSLRGVSTSGAIKWCAVGTDEKAKCDTWSSAGGNAMIECLNADTVDECLKKIMREEADAMALDGGQVYIAGQCGLVPVMVEQYDDGLCNSPGSASTYYAVAVVKKGSGVTWDNLKDKRSCHTGIGKTAGWNIPMGQIYQMTNNCDFTLFFSSGCAPGAEPNSTFCTQCVGSGNADDDSKCKASTVERYYGYAGAFRCLVEGHGDVAFIKHTTVPDNSDGDGPTWADTVTSADYELICPGAGPVPVSQYASCNLAKVPAHAVVTRPETRNKVVDILKQIRFGSIGATFRLFQSDGRKNLLFKDSTKCLQEITATTTFQDFLGSEYINTINMLRQCSDLENSCTFHSCQQKD